jgi:dodecin
LLDRARALCNDVGTPFFRKPIAPREAAMEENVYRIIRVVGSSKDSISDAIDRAISRASKNLHNLRWFEVVETRGNIKDGRAENYQVTLRVGFTLDED